MTEQEIIRALDSYFEKTDKRFLDTAKIPRICDDIREIKLTLKENLGENLYERMDKKYASKTVEKIVYSATGIILFAVLSALLYLVIKK